MFYVREIRKQPLTLKWLTVILSFIGLLMVFTRPSSVKADDSWAAPKSIVISENSSTRIDSKFSFIPEFTDSTTLTVHGPSGMTTRNNTLFHSSHDGFDPFRTISIDAENASNRTAMTSGNVYAKYTNVGYYNGQKVDLIARIKGYQLHGNTGRRITRADGSIYGAIGHVSFPTNAIGFTMQGFNYVDLEWQTVRAGTMTPINTAGYYTFNDIDFNQYVSFPDVTYNKIENVLIADKTNVLDYARIGTHRRFAFYGRKDVDDLKYDARHAITILYNLTDKIEFRWGAMTDQRGAGNPNYHPNAYLYHLKDVGGTWRSTGDLLMYTPQKDVITDAPAPTKTQSVSQNAYVKHNGVVHYTVKQTVPYEYSTFWWSSFEMKDEVNKAYTVSNIKVTSLNTGANVTSQFTTSVDANNVVRAVANNSKRASFYNDTYTLSFDAKLDGAKVVQNIGTNSVYKLDNTAWVYASGVSKKTGTTSAQVAKRTLTVNHIDEDGKHIVTAETKTLVDGMNYDVKPRTDLKTPAGRAYRHWTTVGTTKGTINGNHTVTFRYEEPREMVIEHRTHDNSYDGNILLGTESLWEYPEGKVTAKAKTNHYRDSEGYFYRPTPSQGGQQTATVSRGGVNRIILRYDTPRTITLNHYDKDDLRLLRQTYIKGIYDGQTYSTSPLTSLLDVDGYSYRYLSNFTSSNNYKPTQSYKLVDTVYRNMTANLLYERPRIIEILHIDNDSRDVLATDIHHKRIYDTDGYNIQSRADEELKYYHAANDTTYFYYPLNAEAGQGRARLTGTVIEAQVDKARNTYTLRFYYTKPALDLGVSYIRIDTDRAESGLPVKLEFDHQIIVPERWANYDVTLTLYDRETNMVVYQETDLDVDSIVDGYDIRVKSDHRRKGSNAVYEAVLTTNNKQDVVSGYATSAAIDTNAYVASERILKAESIPEVNVTVSYEGVAMTERRLGRDIQEHFERTSATIEPSVNIISGYAYEYEPKITFETEVVEHSLPDIKGVVYAHPNIADGDYEVVDGLHTFDLESVHSDGDLSRETFLRMPELFVNRKDGQIFKDNADGRITGGRKVYAPIWVNQLGNYTYNVDTSRLGRNYVKFDIDQNVTLDAYMFGHIDSDTLDDDALLIEPAKTSMLDKFFKGR